MRTAERVRSSGVVIVVLLVAFSSCVESQDGISLVVGESSSLYLSPTLRVENSPGTKRGTVVLCERVYIRGLSRLKNLDKYAYSLKVKVAQNSSVIKRTNAEVCFHRNASRGIGMCPQGQWEKVLKGTWVQAMSPFDSKILDVRLVGSSLETLEVSIEEEFFMYRIIFLIMGTLLLSVASNLSKSLAFYYSSAMAVGIILVILVVLFQGMKLLPTGRKSSLAIFLYSSLVGVGSFFLSYLPGLLQSLLVEMGISEDMYAPLAIFLAAFLLITGAWLGFWIVRKLVLTEDGSVDISTSHFVAWSIRILAIAMILQSSVDPLLAGESLMVGIIVSSVLRRVTRSKSLHRMLRKFFKTVKKGWSKIHAPDLSPIRDSLHEYTHKKPEYSDFMTPRSKHFPLSSCRNPLKEKFSDSDVYPSTFHQTHERIKFSKDEWAKFTRESTKKAVEELVSSPDFGKWAAANADRISVTPHNGPSGSRGQRRRWWPSWISSG